MEIGIPDKIRGLFKKSQPASETIPLKSTLPEDLNKTGKNLRFPTSPWYRLRPDITEGPLKDAIGGDGPQSLFNAHSDGVVIQGDNIQVVAIKQTPEGGSPGEAQDYYYVEPSEPLFDPKGKDNLPRHVLYSKSKDTVETTGRIVRWTRLVSRKASDPLPRRVEEGIQRYLAEKAKRV